MGIHSLVTYENSVFLPSYFSFKNYYVFLFLSYLTLLWETLDLILSYQYKSFLGK